MAIMDKQDALTSNLFAQLAADTKVSRVADSKSWDNYFYNYLTIMGWISTDPGVSHREISLTDDHFVLANFLQEELNNQLSHSEFSFLQRFLIAFEKLPDTNDAVKLLYYKTYEENSVNFMLTVFDETNTGETSLLVFQVSFKMCKPFQSYLFHQYETSCIANKKIFVTLSRHLFNKGQYSRVREGVIKKVGAHMDRFVKKISFQ